MSSLSRGSYEAATVAPRPREEALWKRELPKEPNVLEPENSFKSDSGACYLVSLRYKFFCSSVVVAVVVVSLGLGGGGGDGDGGPRRRSRRRSR